MKQRLDKTISTLTDDNGSNNEQFGRVQTTKQVAVILEEHSLFSSLLWTTWTKEDSPVLQLLDFYSNFLLREANNRRASSGSLDRLNDHDLALFIKTISSLVVELASQMSSQSESTAPLQHLTGWDKVQPYIINFLKACLLLLGKCTSSHI